MLTPIRVGVLVTVAIAAGCACGPEAVKPSDPVLAKGYDVYKARCASCHGPNGEGLAGPKLGGGQAARRYPDIAAQETVIREGITNKGMPAFGDKLSADDVTAVARYERESLTG